MKTVVSAVNRSLKEFRAQTENEIAVSFAIEDGSTMQLHEVLEVDLLSLVDTQTVRRASTGQLVRVRLRDFDIHDLRLPSGHGTSRVPSRERLSAA